MSGARGLKRAMMKRQVKEVLNYSSRNSLTWKELKEHLKERGIRPTITNMWKFAANMPLEGEQK